MKTITKATGKKIKILFLTQIITLNLQQFTYIIWQNNLL